MAVSLVGFGLGLSPSSLANDVVQALVRVFESGVEGAVQDILGPSIAATTQVGLGDGGWFSSMAGLLVPVAELVVAPLLFAATIGAVLRQDMRRLARAWCVGLPVAGIAGAAGAEFAAVALNVSDALSAAIQHQVTPDLASVWTKALAAALAASDLGGPVLGIVLCSLFLAGVVIIWLEMAVRSAAVEIAVFFMPLAFAGLVWPVTAIWAKRLVELLAALMLAKPVVVGTLCLGASAVTGGSGLSAGVEGLAVLLMAAFAPMALLKLVPMVEASAVSHLEGISRAPLNAAQPWVQRGSAFASPSGGIPTTDPATASVAVVTSGLSSSARHLLSGLGRHGPGEGGGQGGESGFDLGPAGPPRRPGPANAAGHAGGGRNG